MFARQGSSCAREALERAGLQAGAICMRYEKEHQLLSHSIGQVAR